MQEIRDQFKTIFQKMGQITSPKQNCITSLRWYCYENYSGPNHNRFIHSAKQLN